MFPTLFEAANGLGAHTYGLFIMLAFCAAFVVTNRLASRVGIHPMRLLPVYLAAGVGGLLGGRILYSLAVEPGLSGLLAQPTSLFQASGFAFYGGLFGGMLAVIVVAIPMGIRPWKLSDIAAPAVLMGLGTGRLGCFFAGCCHGAIAPLGDAPVALLSEASPLQGQIWLGSQFPFLATEFHGGVGRILHKALYPTQLWSAAAGLSLCGAMLWLWNHRRFDGQIAALTLMLEPLFRISIEAFRADNRGTVVQWEVSDSVAALLPGMMQAGTDMDVATMGLTTSQAFGLGMVLVGAMIYASRRNSEMGPETPLDPIDDD